MKSFFILVGAIFAANAFAVPQAGEVMADREVLVKFRTSASSATTKKMALLALRAQVVEEFSFIGWTRVRYTDNRSVAAAVQYFKGFGDVAAAEPNYLNKPMFVPNDTRWAQQYGPRKIKADLAWNITQGAPTVIVAVLDTGVELTHPDLQGKLVPGRDFSDNDNDVTDTDGHGTHCVGNIGAATNNATGIAGVAFNCKVMPLKIFPNSFDATVINAIKYAADNGAKVASMSFGNNFFSQAQQDAMNYATNKGMVLVASSGNDGNEIVNYPAGLQNVISVGASDQNDNMADFSTHGDWVRVAAPGVAIMSTSLHGGYANLDGTSMACPIVAGVAALCFARAGNNTNPAVIRNAIYNNCDPVGNWVHFGRVNALRTLQAIAPPLSLDFPASSISLYTGTSSSGNLASIATTNNQYFSVLSGSSSLGQVAGVVADIPITHSMAENVTLKMTLETSGATGGTMFVYLKNRNTGEYDYYRAFPTSTSDRTEVIDIAPVGTYVSGSNVVSVLLRNTRSPRITPNLFFNFNVDFLKLTGTFRS